jgi:hypothetical protein
MYASSSIADFVDWSQPTYNLRVRQKLIFLWGSAGILENIPFDKPLLLHVRNDLFGEAITLSKQFAPPPGTLTVLGTLQPGECVSIPVQGISGVCATCVEAGVESTVSCLIKEPK